ncbi:MAG: Asr1405/Asl0597 family protein [Phormidesmis sp.]
MSSFHPTVESSQAPATPTPRTQASLTVECEDRWQVYHRLQELDIACECSGFQPLKVTIQTATEALQLWSVARRVSQSRQSLVMVLMQSWRLPCE